VGWFLWGEPCLNEVWRRLSRIGFCNWLGYSADHQAPGDFDSFRKSGNKPLVGVIA
jgi:hypothetical protein